MDAVTVTISATERRVTMTDEQLEFIALCQRDMIYNTNMTLDEAWAFGCRCWELGLAKELHNDTEN